MREKERERVERKKEYEDRKHFFILREREILNLINRVMLKYPRQDQDS